MSSDEQRVADQGEDVPCGHRWDGGAARRVGHECFRATLHKGGHVCRCGAVAGPSLADAPRPEPDVWERNPIYAPPSEPVIFADELFQHSR